MSTHAPAVLTEPTVPKRWAHEYACLMRWAAHESRAAHPSLALLHLAIFTPTVRLVALPVARKGAHGLYLHLGHRVTKAAAWWHARLRTAGFLVLVCADWTEAIAALAVYDQKDGGA